MGEKNLKDHIRAVIDYVQGDQQKILNNLSKAEKDEVGSLERWSFKDVVVHSNYWWGVFLQRLEANQKGEKPLEKVMEDCDQINDALQEEHKNDNWEKVLKEHERVMQAIYGCLEKLDEQILRDKEKFTWMHGRPVFNQFLGNCWHDEWHYARYLAERGKVAEATKMHEAFVAQIKPIEEWYSIAVYNLACFYSVSGMKEEAIKTLRKALKLRPDIKEWSKEDPDFDNIREEPDYLTLYE